MKKLYLIAKSLSEDVKELKNDLFAFNPAFENNKHKSLNAIAADAGILAWEFAKLRTEITKMHEENQKKE